MADGKTTQLSIVIRTVDQATAKIKAINDRLDAATKPIRNFKEALGDLRSKSGLDDVIGGFKGVGSAIGDLLGKVALIGGVIGLAGAGMMHLIGEFDDLGDKAERFGVSVDFLAQMRYAAEKAGAPLADLDTGMEAFSVSLGKARAGTGRMLAFLSKVSPALASQLKGAKSNEAAFDILADAMAKITDPAKKAALATATLGSASLAPLMSKGAKGVKELRDKYLEFAGSQEKAADEAGKVDDSLHDLKASTDGIKAALVEGLAPAIGGIVVRLREWFKENRENVRDFAASLGEKLPGAFASLISGVRTVIDTLEPFFNSTTKIKIALGVLAAVMVGPLVSAIATLGIALLTTPIGWILGGLALLGGAAYMLIKHWGPVKDFFVAIWESITGAFKAAWEDITAIVDKIKESIDWIIDKLGVTKVGDALTQFQQHGTGGGFDVDLGKAFGPQSAQTDQAAKTDQAIDEMRKQMALVAATQAAAAVQAALPGAPQAATIKVDFANVPKGTRVKTDPSSTADVDLSVGYQMGWP